MDACKYLDCFLVVLHLANMLCLAFFIFADMSAQEQESISGMLNVAKTHANTLETFRADHSSQAASIEEKAHETFQQQFRVCSLIFNFDQRVKFPFFEMCLLTYS